LTACTRSQLQTDHISGASSISQRRVSGHPGHSSDPPL